MDFANRRPQLSALSYLDVDKVKREEDYQNRNTSNVQSLSTSAAASPIHRYPSGPPPPYSHAHTIPPPQQHANTWPTLTSAVHTPPESRRTSEHEKEGAKQPPRQSLPSISEALGVDSQTTFAPSTAPPPPLQAHLPHPSPAAAPGSPSPTSRRAYPMEPPHGPPTSFPGTNSFSQMPPYRTEPAAQQSYPSVVEAARTSASYAPVQDPKQSLHLQTSQPPSRQSHSTPFSRPPDPSPTYEHPPSHPTGAMGPPSSFPYGYTPYPPRYANPTPPSSVASGPTYQPTTTFNPSQPAPGWKSESSTQFEDRQAAQANYGDNVKRHLDFYDLEVALNEIGSASGILSDFARRYGDRMHQTQRSGATLSTLPGIVEVDDMVSKSRVQLESLLKIREVIHAQQALYEQQIADQRINKSFTETAQPVPDQQQAEADDKQTGGFAGVDTKKRRGRAAPPGRCHSCNRAETPEWRRGPDGARTLCNACGLHYAKLTRKKNGANNTTNVGSSNLRPKESVPQ